MFGDGDQCVTMIQQTDASGSGRMQRSARNADYSRSGNQ